MGKESLLFEAFHDGLVGLAKCLSESFLNGALGKMTLKVPFLEGENGQDRLFQMSRSSQPRLETFSSG